MPCCICGAETPPRHIYCDHCRQFLGPRHDNLKRRHALQAAYDRALDAFRCHHCRVILEEEDRSDPFGLVFDHLMPTQASELVVSSALLNHMKCEFTPDEFHRAVKELAAHFDGRPFRRDRVSFEHWRRRAPAAPRPPKRLQRGELTKVIVEGCTICGAPPVRWSYFCTRCRRFALMHTRARRLHAEAMRRAWSAEAGGFLCAYTGVRVEEDDPTSPWYFTFDHATPGDNRTLVVAAYWVNSMKTALSKDEFEAVIKEYARYLDEGGEFDRYIVDFKYWRNTRRASRGRRR